MQGPVSERPGDLAILNASVFAGVPQSTSSRREAMATERPQPLVRLRADYFAVVASVVVVVVLCTTLCRGW